MLSTAKQAALRETLEETNVSVEPESLVFFSHWLPPAQDARKRGKRFSTFFFAGRISEGSSEVEVDGGEISLTVLFLSGIGHERMVP